MLKFLLNANLSRESAKFLNTLGHDAKTVTEFGLGEAEDEKIIALTITKERILITFDLDFGEML
jgi:predicted nuclease of predicted toxin-antitoxin system